MSPLSTPHRLSRRTTRLLVVAAGAVAVIAGQSPAPTSTAVNVRVAGKYSPPSGAYVGTYSSTTGLSTTKQIEDYYQSRETLAGRTLDIQNFMPGWSNPLASDLVKWDIAQGIIPLVSWNTPDSVSDQSIVNGNQDGLIKTQADQLKALNAKVFLRLDWEMNGNWFAWDGTHNNSAGKTDGPAKYVAMWRHIHDIFSKEGANNVAWVWTPSSSSLPDTAWNSFSAYYPGDGYVDWVGLDDYNYGGLQGHSLGWNDFSSQLQPFYGQYSWRKPMMIGEMGSADNLPGHDRGQWIAKMASDVKLQFPDIQALIWFDVKFDVDWRFDTSTSSLNAFRAWLAMPYYNPMGKPDRYTSNPTPPPTTATPTPRPTATPTPRPTPTPIPTPVPTSPATAVGGALLVSSMSNRANPQPLSGATLGFNAYVFASYSRTPNEVDFYIDDIRQSGAPHSIERSAPFDLAGTSGAVANRFDSSGLTPGQHVLTAIATFADGTRSSTTAVFSAGVGPDPALIDVKVSASANRSSAWELSGSSVGGDIYVTAAVSGVPTAVSFYIDDAALRGSPAHTEHSWPYDLMGGSPSGATPFNASALGQGQHTLTVVAWVNGIGRVDRTMVFTVA